ncbi:MAG TPA: energy-coupling factor transporter transmembrane component T [Thermoplasmata archaeon]|nr:energy-coupling factor transporter transmembrane component T [Thermoplasmata archaeon]
MARFEDLYTEADTFLHRLDPRVKMASVLMLSLLAFILSALACLLVLLTFIFVLLILARSSYRKTAFAMKFVLRFMALIAILWPLFDPSGTPVLIRLGPVVITEPGIWRGLASAVRVGCLATVWYILIFTTSQRDLVRGLVKLGLRFDFGLSMAIALRYFPTFGTVMDSIIDAQRSRGMEFEKGNMLVRARKYVAVLGPAIVSALKTADMLALALQSRAYGARRNRTYLRELRMRPSDYVALVTALAMFIVPAVAKYAFSVPI